MVLPKLLWKQIPSSVSASFQETTKVLRLQSKGKVDHLVGLKENVIIGKLISRYRSETLQRYPVGYRHAQQEAPTVDEETAESLPEDEETITLEETVDAADDEIINAEEKHDDTEE